MDWATPGWGWRIDLVIPGEAVEEVGPTGVAAGAVQIDQGIAGAALGNLYAEHTAADGYHPLTVSNHGQNTSLCDDREWGAGAGCRIRTDGGRRLFAECTIAYHRMTPAA